MQPIPDDYTNGVIIKSYVECCAVHDVTNSSKCSWTEVGNDRFSAVLELDARAQHGCTVKSANAKKSSSESERIIVLGSDDGKCNRVDGSSYVCCLAAA